MNEVNPCKVPFPQVCCGNGSYRVISCLCRSFDDEISEKRLVLERVPLN